MDININLNGLDAVREAVSQAEEQLRELRTAITSIDRAMQNMAIEISQPPADTNG